MQKLVQHSSIGVAVVLCKARIEVFPGRVAADRMQNVEVSHPVLSMLPSRKHHPSLETPALQADPLNYKPQIQKPLYKPNPKIPNANPPAKKPASQHIVLVQRVSSPYWTAF